MFAILFPRLNMNNLNQKVDNEVENLEKKLATFDKERHEEVTLDISSSVIDIVEEVSSTVVGITNIQNYQDLWDEEANFEEDTGSGVIYKVKDEDAYIVTNNHVVENADEVEVVLENGDSYEGELLGSDLFSDLAVVKVHAPDIKKAIKMGKSEHIKVGEPVIAIGNPLGHMLAGSVTQGVISGKQRTIPQDFDDDGNADWQAEVIQTDAAINPGNSGGALLNIKGELIGINSMKINQSLVEGIGFSIPIDAAKPIIDELETEGVVQRPYIGVELYALDEISKAEQKASFNLPKKVTSGVYIWSVEPFSPAHVAGLQKFDVITKLDDKSVSNLLELRDILYNQRKTGDEIDVTFYRDGEEMHTSVVLGVQ